MTKDEIQEHFKAHGTGNITEIKLMNGFGFIEYDDAMDARDVVPGKSIALRSYVSMLTISLQLSVRVLHSYITREMDQ